MISCCDLFSGLGGASQAFVDRGHNVKRYDIEPKFADVAHTEIADVQGLVGSELKDIDIVLAGFPCNNFSILANHITWPNGEPREDTQEMIVFVKEIKLWLEQSDIPYYIIENPRGMMRSSKALGKPDATLYWAAYGAPYLKPTDLWGRLPPLERKMPHKWEKAPRGSNLGVASNHLSAAERALWPYDFSLAVCLAVEGNSPQRTLGEYF